MSSPARKEVLVLGASGRFGGIVDLLVARGHQVRAGVRDPGSASAARLRDLGAEVVRGDFDDAEGIGSAALGRDAVFASGTAHRVGPDGELRHGITLADTLAGIGVPHLVFVSGAGADRATGVPVLEAKRTVEQRIALRRLPATVLAPVYLMENLFNPWNIRLLAAGRFPTPVAPSLRLDQVSIADIISVAAAAIEHPQELKGERIELASDAPTGEETAAALSNILGRPLIAEQLERAALPPGLVALFESLERAPVTVELSGLRRRFNEVRWHDFASWAYEHREQLAAAISAPTQT